MITPFEVIQSTMAFGIIIFSIVSLYYGIRTIIIHVQTYGKLMDCCWIMALKTGVHFLFGAIFFILILRIFFTNIITIVPGTFSTLFLEPLIFLNAIVNSIYTKRSFLEAKNLERWEVFKNGQ